MSATFTEIDTLIPWFFPMVAAVFGAMVGSFLNVVIYRVPAGKSVVRPGSQCACGQSIKWHDNIPVLSWFLLRGKARCCDRPYAFRYPAVEALTGALFWGCWMVHPPVVAISGMVLLGMLIAATFIDLDHMIIPDGITIWGTVVGVLMSFLLPQIHGQGTEPFYLLGSIRAGFSAMIGALIGSGIILWIGLISEAVLKKEAMGFGDVKFMGLIGAFLGWQGAVFSVFAGAIVGTAWFLIALLVQTLSGRKQAAALRAETPEGEETEVGFGAHVPFGPMLAIAAAIYLLGGSQLFTPFVEQLLELW